MVRTYPLGSILKHCKKREIDALMCRMIVLCLVFQLVTKVPFPHFSRYGFLVLMKDSAYLCTRNLTSSRFRVLQSWDVLSNLKTTKNA